MLTLSANNKKLDLVTHCRIQGMLGLLNLYFDEGLELSWRKSLAVVLKAQEHGNNHAQCICKWTLQYLQTKALPLHHLGQVWWMVLRDKDIMSEIKLKMVKKSKKGFVRAEDIVNLVASLEMQRIFFKKGICKASISTRTATCWLKKLDWRYQSTQNGMYIDGHERKDVVAY